MLNIDQISKTSTPDSRKKKKNQKNLRMPTLVSVTAKRVGERIGTPIVIRIVAGMLCLECGH